MAIKGQSISNKITGEHITWLETAKDTNGQRLKARFSVGPKGRLPVVHFHPNQVETFEFIEGEFCLKVGDETKNLHPGDTVVIQKGVPHTWWNPSETDTAQMIVSLEPALNSEIFLEQFFGLCNDGKAKADGTPYFMQIMACINTYQIYIEGPPLLLQKIMGYTLGSLARLLGYKTYYPEYSNQN